MLEISNEKIDSPEDLADFIDVEAIKSQVSRMGAPTLEAIIALIKAQMDPGGIHATDDAVRKLAEKILSDLNDE